MELSDDEEDEPAAVPAITRENSPMVTDFVSGFTALTYSILTMG